MGVYSDYPAEQKLAAMGVAVFMDLILYSGEPAVDVLKPHPKGFKLAAERLQLKPEEILYVGDRPEVDAAGAKAAGMDCRLVGPHGDYSDYHALAKSLDIKTQPMTA